MEWSNNLTSYEYYESYSETMHYTGVSTSHGYQFNPNLFVGAGLAVERNTKYDQYIVPIFAQVRTDQTWGKFTPFADLRAGLSIADEGCGYYLSPTIGYRFNWGRKVNLNVGLGLTLRGYNVEKYSTDFSPNDGGYFTMDYIGTDHRTQALFAFRIGIDF